MQHHTEAPDVAQVARLLRLAGPRPQMPLERRLRVRSRVHDQWTRHLRRRAWARRGVLGAVALAAAALVAVALEVPPAGSPAPARRVARVEVVRGEAHVSRDGQRRPASPDEALVTGERLLTDVSGRLALRWEDGVASVRLDLATEVELVSPETLRLERGAVYVDAGDRPSGAGGLAVLTRFGVVRDVGTRFEVRAGASLRVRVREGRVSVEAPGLFEKAEAGEELSIDPAGALRRGSVPRFGPAWAWVLEAAPPFDLERRPLGTYLDWVSRESGLVVRFDDPSLEDSARATVVRGSVDGVTPLQSLDVVLPAAGLEHRIEDGVLRIREAS